MIGRDDIIAAGRETRLYIAELDRDDAAWAVDVVLDRVIDRLRADPAIPRRTLEQWTLFFAEVRNEAEDDLTKKLKGFARVRDTIEAMADVLAEDDDDDEDEAA